MPDSYQADDDHSTLSEVIALAKQDLSPEYSLNGNLTPAFENLIQQMVLFATGEDRIWAAPQALLDRAKTAWKFGEKRMPERHAVSLAVSEGDDWRERRLVLDITTDDRPFLVDSISAALTDAGKPVSFFSNTVVDVVRDEHGARTTEGAGAAIRESIIHAEMDPPVDQSELDELAIVIDGVLADVTVAVDDWEPMRARLGACIAQLERSRPKGVDLDEHQEAVGFLKWLWDNRFAFLGVRRYTYSKNGDETEFLHDEAGDLGILRDTERRILKQTFTAHGDLSPAVQDFLDSHEPIIVAKANTKSRVHRRVYMDYVGVKSYSVDGRATGEDRFVGLFTSDAYNRPASDIPLLRSKIKKTIQHTAFLPGGYNEKALLNILETFPRDELFQVDRETLREMSLGVLRLLKRPRVKLFLRRDRFDRFISALVFIPRDRFNSEVREQIGDYLASTFEGQVTSFSPFFGDASLVRVHYIIGIDAGAPDGPGLTELTRTIRRICQHWSDDLLHAMRLGHEGALPAGLFAKYENAFDAAYRDRTTADEALTDIKALETLSDQPMVLRAFRRSHDQNNSVRLKLYRRDGALSLSKIIPSLENLGLDVLREASYAVRPNTHGEVEELWIQDFLMVESRGRNIRLEDVRADFEAATIAVLNAHTEDDGFNSLVLSAGLNWREVAVMRAASKFSLQAGFQYSQNYIEETLSKHAEIVSSLNSVFHARFNPSGAADLSDRTKDVEMAVSEVLDNIAEVSSLEEDSILRRILNFLMSTVRTNYFQTLNDGEFKPYISFKIDSDQIDNLPQPHPHKEIFVSGPRVDGVHLRFGPIARGGLRWSDRREDFRTEVLGLVKAQRVKNAVIVPTGSKGCFYPKQLPQTDDRAAVYEAGREAYKEFIRGLLDVTDNIVERRVVSPQNTVVWDANDPYLVVAADKGTAQFSDTANGISEDYGFWLGDAFASGGSAGYDHKAMGITARGAWEAVKRHFREMGKDIQTESFTAAGVGDMSGDVFGNGMLLSEQTRLVAAFDHRDIFIDPDPNPQTSYKERERLFGLTRSSWQDYDPEKISKGGGVFSRSSKSIKLTDQMRSALGTDKTSVTPNELIKIILRSPVELFWLGGIGTYFKAGSEENTHVGDKANDAVRINADEMRCAVVGEGANLGLTQRARIEFARNGGRVNTDAIDNSAGVDSSDHEVNIKILLSSAIERAELDSSNREELLASMTEAVAQHVLRHNYEQTRALTQLEVKAIDDLGSHERFVKKMEAAGRLNREVETLPDTETFANLNQSGGALTRPELSVLLAYAKMALFDELVASEAPDDQVFEQELFAYFPDAVREFNHSIVNHRLRREIIATRLANEVVNVCGISFVQRAAETTGATTAEIVLAYEAARRIFELSDFAAAIDDLDNKVSADLQMELYLSATSLLKEQVYRLLSSQEIRNGLSRNGVKSIVDRYGEPVHELHEALEATLPPEVTAKLDERAQSFRDRGAPEDLSVSAASLPVLERALDIIDIAADTGWSHINVGTLFFAVGRKFSIAEIRERAFTESPKEHYDKIAMRQLIEEFACRQQQITSRIIEFVGNEPEAATDAWVEETLSQWSQAQANLIDPCLAFLHELEPAGSISVGKLILLNKRLGEIIQA